MMRWLAEIGRLVLLLTGCLAVWMMIWAAITGGQHP